jgi:hypothetical protein
MKAQQTPGFFNFTVGDLQLMAVTDGQDHHAHNQL